MQKISKRAWLSLGGLMSPKTARKYISGQWHYYRID